MIVPDEDGYGGYALYWQNQLIGRIYYYTLDNKSFYQIVRENISQEEMEYLIDTCSIFEHEDCFLIDNLTGTRIPNDKYQIYYGFTSPDSTSLRLCVGFRQQIPPTLSFSPGDSWLSKNIKKGIHYFKYALSQTKKGFYACCNAICYTSRTRKKLDENVKQYLATQDHAVIDLRRGYYWFWEDETLRQVCGTEDNFKKEFERKCPFQKEDIAHIWSFVLALPGQCHNEDYLELRSWIDPEKVEELVIFDPVSLNEFLAYRHIKKLKLFNAEQLDSLEELEHFKNLDDFWISGKEKILEIKGLNEIDNKIKIETIVLPKRIHA